MNNLPKESVRKLLAETVDYAGLFPPSAVSMETAVENYARYVTSENAWLLGRFVVPAARLDEFSKHAEKHFSKKNVWRLSVLAGENLAEDLEKIDEFNERRADAAFIDTLETKAAKANEIAEASKILPKDSVLKTYFEIPSNAILTDLMTALALNHHRAKIRTGGVTPEAFPPTDDIVKFARICIAANVPFKATAGLHHPLRCVKPLTYEEDAPKGTMNGFLNLFLTSVFLRKNLNNTHVHKLINDGCQENFTFEDEQITWLGNAVTLDEIRVARERNIISFGSCSFEEPIEDLRQMQLID